MHVIGLHPTQNTNYDATPAPQGDSPLPPCPNTTFWTTNQVKPTETTKEDSKTTSEDTNTTSEDTNTTEISEEDSSVEKVLIPVMVRNKIELEYFEVKLSRSINIANLNFYIMEFNMGIFSVLIFFQAVVLSIAALCQ